MSFIRIATQQEQCDMMEALRERDCRVVLVDQETRIGAEPLRIYSCKTHGDACPLPFLVGEDIIQVPSLESVRGV